MEQKRRERLEKFQSSRQEPVRLAIALEEFFLPARDDEACAVYETYLKRRLRPVVAALIDREDIRTLEAMRRLGWLSLQQIDDGIAHARQTGRTVALIWLLGVKAAEFGWRDRDFTL